MSRKAVLNVPVSFLGVSIGATTARLGIKIARDDLELTEADFALCGHRLTGSVTVQPSGEHPDQKEAFDTGKKLVIQGTFDVKRFGVSPDDFSAGLTFGKRDVDISELSGFANRTGNLRVDNVSEIPEDEETADEHGEEAEEEEPAPKAVTAAAPKHESNGHHKILNWRDVPIAALNLSNSCQVLSKAGIENLGQMADYERANSDGLKGLEGMTAKRFTHVTERVQQYWEGHPEHSAQHEEWTKAGAN